MPPFVWLSAAETPEEPRPPTPVGQSTAVPLPTRLFHSELTRLRKSVMLYVVPEPSLRWMTVMDVFGMVLPLFSALIAGASQALILPRKMSASTLPFRRIRFGPPSSLYGIEVAESAHGIWTQLLHAANWSGVSGASLAPKSTVRFVICAMPPPLPIGPYVTLMSRAPSTFATQACTSFETKVLPAPVKLPPVTFEPDAPAPLLAVRASEAINASTMASFLVKCVLPCSRSP